LTGKEHCVGHLEYDLIDAGTVTTPEYGPPEVSRRLNPPHPASDGQEMRVTLVAVAVVVAALIGLNRAAGPSVDPDVAVRVVAADPIRLVLPINPEANAIVAGMSGELRAAADAAPNRTLSRELDRIAADTAYLTWLADTGVDYFSSGKAVALAYSLYNVDITTDPVVLTSVTAELVPQYGSVGYSADHEDGHAYINEEVARRCGGGIVRGAAADGLRGGRLEATIISELRTVGDRAHNIYHGYVNGGFVSNHLSHARRAAEEAVAALCSP
jgi:hypothetical protein